MANHCKKQFAKKTKFVRETGTQISFFTEVGHIFLKYRLQLNY